MLFGRAARPVVDVRHDDEYVEWEAVLATPGT
jgi:hypothetical protein